jgi:hypothetical protein
VKEIRDWLRVRGLPSHGKKVDIMERLQHLLSLPDVPQILPPKGGSIQDVMTLTQVMGVAIGNVMQRSITKEFIARTRYYIKRFLSSYHDVDKYLIKDGDKPGWLTSYNYMCLLNIPDMMELYGPIPNLWEGGYDGEKFSQELKHRLRGGLKDNWHRNLLRNILADDVMKRIELPLQIEVPKDNESKHKEKCYKSYNSLISFMQDYVKRLPLSVIRNNNGHWGSLISSEKKIQRVAFNEYEGCINGMHYWSINVIENEILQVMNIEQMENINYCILLPRLTEHGLPTKMDEPIFCVIESTWKDIVPDSNYRPVFNYPSIS